MDPKFGPYAKQELAKGFRAALIARQVFLPKGHFALDAEYHASGFFQSKLALVNPEILAVAAEFIAAEIAMVAAEVEMLVAPPGCGIALTTLAAASLTKQPRRYAPLVVHAIAQGGGLDFFPAFRSTLEGRKAVVVEWFCDGRNNGTALAEAASHTGAEILAVAAVWNAGPTRQTLRGVPILAAIEEEFELFPADNCPLCRSGQPVDAERGAGPEFVEARLALAL